MKELEMEYTNGNLCVLLGRAGKMCILLINCVLLKIEEGCLLSCNINIQVQ